MADVAPANPGNVNPSLGSRIKSFLGIESKKEPKVMLAAHEVEPVGMLYHVPVPEDGTDVYSMPAQILLFKATEDSDLFGLSVASGDKTRGKTYLFELRTVRGEADSHKEYRCSSFGEMNVATLSNDEINKAIGAYRKVFEGRDAQAAARTFINAFVNRRVSNRSSLAPGYERAVLSSTDITRINPDSRMDTTN
jgi:hypothetical protein